mmetsp:Transcript_12388/g.18579  ORF Transcript_12388/g.18579 Transcript_12388/m.18579 type:complete len:91 (+) Transcript_12388:126-398(+)
MNSTMNRQVLRAFKASKFRANSQANLNRSFRKNFISFAQFQFQDVMVNSAPFLVENRPNVGTNLGLLPLRDLSHPQNEMILAYDEDDDGR